MIDADGHDGYVELTPRGIRTTELRKRAKCTAITPRNPEGGLEPRSPRLMVRYCGRPDQVVCPLPNITRRTPFVLVVQSVLASLDRDVSVDELERRCVSAWGRAIVYHPNGDPGVLQRIIELRGSMYHIKWV